MTKKLLIGIALVVVLAAVIMVITYSTRRSIPEGVVAVQNFDSQKYLGKWYEIARFDFHWEKNLEQCTAEYSLRQDGDINVQNRGFNVKKDKWKASEGKAKFVGEHNVGMLKVSFFGPFYAGYNVVSVDNDYNYALVFGRNLDYMWILSREKQIPESIRSKYLMIAQNAGYDISKLIWTVQ